MRLWILAAALACSTAAQAATVVKCVDGAGKVSFAQNACPPGTSGEQVQVREAPRPSGDGPAVQMADPSKTYAPPKPTIVRVRREKPAPEVVKQEPEKVRAPSQAVARPCMKTVLVPYNYRQRNADGTTSGVAGTRKVQVPCNQR
ncbi:DUF4124 domain-containing protein [Metapseudomonas otitidis]|uniref:DUF4124 domain-containing protein n=1 Tax=Metapseudomonas otitidis TaxID=319939 RepID=UPI001F3EE9E1|nr:DUF4124 domain-containing protein [Pseudomonas otitidis]MCO7558028.1 DUF4124 domain-containing protein [Pseudomonas otitidis]